MTIKFNDTWPLKGLLEASAKLDAQFDAAPEADRGAIKAQQLYVRALIETKTPKTAWSVSSVERLRQLGGLNERFDDDEFDRHSDPDNAFGASRHGKDAIDPDKIVGDGEGGERKFPGVRPPHVGSGKPPAPKPAMTRRQAAKNIDPEILRQLAGEDGNDEAEAADSAAPTPSVNAAGPVTAAPLDGAAPVDSTVGGAAPATGAAPAASAMARGEKAAKARDYLAINKGATRGEFIKFAARELGMSGNYSNTLYYALKKRMAGATQPEAAATPVDAPMETWTVRNAKGLSLADGTGYDIPVWTPYDKDSAFEPKIFENERYAKKAVEALAKYGFHKVTVVKESF